MGATHLHQSLKSLCRKTEWNYAVFWKLEQHDHRMVLTWEDGYCTDQDKLAPSDTSQDDEDLSCNSVGLSVAKMSYQVHSLGEGIVGQVALTGKHQWIIAGEHSSGSYSSLQFHDGWQAQFAAGIKTIVVAAVVPHGVIQFGSLTKVNESMQFLAHIRDIFSSLQYSTYQIETPIHCNNNLHHILQTSEIQIPSIRNVDGYSSQSCITESTALVNELHAFKTIDTFPEFGCFDQSSGDLHEALGPAFLKQCYSFESFPYEAANPEPIPASVIPEPVETSMETSMLSSEAGKDHLLEAVVANFCRRDALKKSKSISISTLTTERMPESSNNTSHNTIGSSRFSMGGSSFLEGSLSTQTGLNSSDSCKNNRASAEPGKSNKKRARPGENSRPRPRDRQLIQDRIKELRELVPNGSKCSIDSLLERTIKHMSFMQNVTKHSDKLSSYSKSKDPIEMAMLGSGNEQGSSWAVEVGGHMKICPILVENLNTNGQMLIEMLCDDCDHFMEITEAIRSLGLTVLKGVTDGHGDKTWMRFVVEGQGNRNLHRMDVLWSLVQILQSKTSV